MGKYLFWCLWLLLPQIGVAQLKHDVNWVFGINAGLDFSQPGSATPRQYVCNTYEQSASYSDEQGNLVCYLSAYVNSSQNDIPMLLRNSNGTIMQGGDSINTYGSCTAGALFLPKPGYEDNEVWLLASGRDKYAGCGGLYCNLLYTTKIITPSNGQPTVKSKNELVFNTPISERLMAIRHADGKNWWVVTHKKGDTTYVGGISNTFLVFYFDSTGIAFHDSIQLGHMNYTASSIVGSAAVSPKGNLIAYGYDNIGCEVFYFDRCNGTLKLLFDLPNLSWGYGTSFSPNERFLYISTQQDFPPINQITQFDLWSPNPDSSRFNVTNNINGFHKFALGPDGKIYISVQYTGFLSTIEFPNSLGNACGYSRNSIQLLPNTQSVHSLPQMPNYNLGPLPIYQADAGRDTFYCTGDTTIKGVLIGGEHIPGIVYEWGPAPGIDSLQKRTQYVLPAQSRWYYVTLTDTTYNGPSCNSRLDSVYVEVRTCTGISELTAKPARIYPNPTTGTLTIELPQHPSNHHFTLYNLLGVRLMDKPLIENTTLLTLVFPSGIYLYQITGNGPHHGVVQNGKLVVE